MVSVDIYVNETTRHANVILPPEPELARGHYDLALYSLAIRNVANYSPPLVELEPGEVPEWQTMLRLAAVLQGLGPDADVDALDDFVVAGLVQKAVTRAGSNVEGRDADELTKMLAMRRGPERVLDFMLRTGPYGDGFGADPDGLSLAVLEATPARRRSRAAPAARARGAAHAVGQDRARARTRARTTSPDCGSRSIVA